MCEFLGLIRLQLPAKGKSITLPVGPCTSVAELRKRLKIPALFLQLGLQHIRPLSDDCHPLSIQLDILSALGYDTLEERLLIGHSTNLCHIFGNPHPSPLSASINADCLECTCLVRQDGLLRRWQPRKCAIQQSGQLVRIGPGAEGELDELLHMALYEVHPCEKLTLRLVPETTKLAEWHLQFDNINQLKQWKQRLARAKTTPAEDLSNRQLLFLPADLFLLGHYRLISALNLRRNSLQCRLHPPQILGGPIPAKTEPLGWLDDLNAFPSLRQLNLADNRLPKFPACLLLLDGLTELDLSGNKIAAIPPNIRLLANLTSLNLANNWLTQLPASLAKCASLTILDLAFNRFTQIPEVLYKLPNLNGWSLAGNYIQMVSLPTKSVLAKPSKINLRLNPLSLQRFRPSHCPFTAALIALDLRDCGCKLMELELGNLTHLESLHCERNRICKLTLNGTALRELFASQNELDSLAVMPLPMCLAILQLGHNRFQTLPEWITELPKLGTLEVQNNQLRKLPARIFMSVPSLRHLNAANNRLRYLPEVMQHCGLESLVLNGNRLEALPAELFRFASKLRFLNCSQNRLDQLPAPLSASEANIRLKELRLGFNRLSCRSLAPLLGQFQHVRLLDLSHNQIRSLPSMHRMCLLEELNLAGNRLQSLPASLFQLPRLHTLRIHSNLIGEFQRFVAAAKELKVLDLCANKLCNMPERRWLPPKLEQLDLTCNPLGTCQNGTYRKSQLFDLDGQQPANLRRNFSFGFSQTRGQRQRLCIRQLFRHSNYGAVFALIDGGNNAEIADTLHFHLGQLLSENPAIESASAAKRALLRLLERMGKQGQEIGAAILLAGLCPNGRLFCANSGTCSALLLRQTPQQPICLANEATTRAKDPLELERLRAAHAIVTEDGLINGVYPSGHAIGFTALFPAILPDPSKVSLQISSECHSLVIANRHVWANVEPGLIEELIKGSRSAQQAAKIIQDAVQATGCEENIGIIVIEFINQITIF